MSNPNKSIKSALNLVVLGQSINVACPAHEIDSLTSAAKYLDEKLSELRSQYPNLNIDKLIAMLALQLAHESLHFKENEASLNMQLVRYIEDLDRNIAKTNDLVNLSLRQLEKCEE